MVCTKQCTLLPAGGSCTCTECELLTSAALDDGCAVNGPLLVRYICLRAWQPATAVACVPVTAMQEGMQGGVGRLCAQVLLLLNWKEFVRGCK